MSGVKKKEKKKKLIKNLFEAGFGMKRTTHSDSLRLTVAMATRLSILPGTANDALYIHIRHSCRLSYFPFFFGLTSTENKVHTTAEIF